MRSTMQDVPLSVTRILEHGTTVHGRSEVVTATGDGLRTTSYAEIGRRAAQLAHALRGLGISGDERVATFQWNNQEHLEAYLAVPSMGAVLHPLNIRLPADQLRYIARHAQDRVIILDPTLAAPIAALLPDLPDVAHLVLTGDRTSAEHLTARQALAATGRPVHGYEELLAGQPTEFPWQIGDENAAAAMCYTSGTTGHPKGVVYSHRSIYLHSMQVCMGEGIGLTGRARVLAVVPMFHVMAWGLPHAALMTGAELVMPDRYLQAPVLADIIAAARPNRAAAVPTIWSDVLHHVEATGGDLSSLEEVVIGGSACPPSLMRGYERHGVRVLHAWGMTETSPLGSVARPPAYAADGEEEFAYRVTQGRVPASVQARLVGPDGEVMPNDGVSVGELEVRGPWITASYHGLGHEDDGDGAGPDHGGEKDEAAAKFHDGWLRTGDVGTLSADGYLTLTDRAKDVIKSGGEWISSVELENHLMAHPEVAEACVVAVPDDRWGERPLAAVVPAEGHAPDLPSLRAFLADRIARWQVPERWTVIPEVPKTSVGKFDKKALRARYADGGLEVVNLGRPPKE